MFEFHLWPAGQECIDCKRRRRSEAVPAELDEEREPFRYQWFGYHMGELTRWLIEAFTAFGFDSHCVICRTWCSWALWALAAATIARTSSHRASGRSRPIAESPAEFWLTTNAVRPLGWRTRQEKVLCVVAHVCVGMIRIEHFGYLIFFRRTEHRQIQRRFTLAR